MYIYTYIHYRELLLLCTRLRFTLNVSQQLTRFRFYYSKLSVVLVFWSFVWLYVSLRPLLLGLSFFFFYSSSCPSIRCTRCLLMPQGTERFVTCVRQNISGSRAATRSAGSSNTKQPKNSMVHTWRQTKRTIELPTRFLFSLPFYQFRICCR